MAKILDKTVIGMNAPKQTNVTWIDTSDGTPVQRNNINGKWKPVGGGTGSSRGGSSDPTESDVNKVWQVTPVQKGTQTEETVIVPEQTLEDGDVLEYNDKFVPGAQCIAVVNSIEYRGEVVEDMGVYMFSSEFGGFEYTIENEIFDFFNDTKFDEVTVKLSIIEETTTYDYNWVPGVKIPVPTAEDEGKILVVTKTEGSNTSVIVPEQSVPADENTPLTDVDLTKFVVGNTVKVTITYVKNTEVDPNFVPDVPSEQSPLPGQVVLNQSTSLIGVIERDEGDVVVSFDNSGDLFDVWQTDDSLYTDAIDIFGSNSTIKLEYVELNYEYQLQENSGGSSGSSNVLYCEGSIEQGFVTAYIDSSELDNPQITTIVVDTGSLRVFYRMFGDYWLVGEFNSFVNSTDWIKQWDTSGQYPTIYAQFSDK